MSGGPATAAAGGRALTRDGKVALALLGATALVAGSTGSNLVYLVLAALLAAGALELVLGAWNLRGLRVSRALPGELFAGREARGRIVARSTRRWLVARDVTVAEVGGDGAARAEIPELAPGDEAGFPAGWTFPGRGAARLAALRLSSRWPFGLVERSVTVAAAAEVVVWPRPRGGAVDGAPGDGGPVDGSRRAVGAFGDFAGLREYRPGDPIRAIHWPTTARVGTPMVALRTDDAEERVLVRVRRATGSAWEQELGRACGAVLRAQGRGVAVGLELPDATFEARAGGAWSRALLDALARAAP